MIKAESYSSSFVAGAFAIASVLGSAACTRLPAATDAGPVPNGYVDLPHPNETLRAGAQVAGWTFSKSAVKEVAIYVDGSYLQSAQIGLPRPDVSDAYPNVPEADHAGWAAQVQVEKLAPGPHVLLVQARNKAGATRDLAAIPVNVAPR